MAKCDCQVVGSFFKSEQNPPPQGTINLSSLGCIISINVSSKLEILKNCGGGILTGATIGSVSITGYATQTIHTGCPGRAGVSFNWSRRLRCDSQYKVYFIDGGEGGSYIAGDIKGMINGSEQDLAVMSVSTGRAYPTISASSSSGPTAIYMKTNQADGYGLVYIGDPISFDTSLTADENVTRSISINGQSRTVYSAIMPNFGVGEGPMYLQSFSLDLNPGEIPVANYSYAFVIEG
jgi:hypothetical protein